MNSAKPISRMRRWLMICCAISALLLAVAWVVSESHTVGYLGNSIGFGVRSGTLSFHRRNSEGFGWVHEQVSSGTQRIAVNRWRPSITVGTNGPNVRISIYRLPIWIPLVAAMVTAAWLYLPLWRLRQARKADLPPGPRCRTCGYSLIGNSSGRCPECGTEVPERRDTA